MCLVVASHASHAARGMLTDGSLPGVPAYPYQQGVLVFVLALSLSCLFVFAFLSGFMMYRMASTGSAAFQAARQLLQKYLLWAVAGYAGIALLTREFDWQAIGLGVIQGGPFAAYWFLTLIIALYALTPMLSPMVRRWPAITWTAAIALQVASIAEFYIVPPADDAALVHVVLSRIVHFLPAYTMGMLVSRDADSIGAFLHHHRRAFGVAALATGALTGAEAVWMAWRAEFVVGPWWFSERASAVVFSILCLAALMVTRFDVSRGVSKWLQKVGVASLGVLLMTDLFMRFAEFVVWHLPGLLLTGTLPRGEPLPEGVRAYAPLLGIALFAVGILGPLWVMDLARKWLGSRTRFLW